MSSHAGLNAILDEVISELTAAVDSPEHPWHWPAVATTGRQGPEIRTVVLRAWDRAERTVSFHTDVRSAKVEQLRSDPRCAWLFYLPERRIQIVLHCTAEFLTAERDLRKRWDALPDSSKATYRQSQPPAQPLGHPGHVVNAADGFKNFSVVACRIDSLDWLQLSAEGNRRARFTWDDGRLEASWIAP